jgi:uncharacterized protein (TIGR02118 family)
MVKVVFCVRRRPDLSVDDFKRYWIENHALLVKKHAAALGAKRYVQDHTVEDDTNAALRASRGSMEAFDGIAEVWWDSRDALTAALSRPEGQAAGEELLEDERNFIDLARSSLFLTEEHEIFES